MKLIGVKLIINTCEQFKQFVYTDTADDLADLLQKINGGKFADHIEDVVFYYGYSDSYDTSKMHITPKECRFSELLSRNESRPFVLIKINKVPSPDAVFPNAFNRLLSAQTTLILPTKSKYKNVASAKKSYSASF